MEGLRFKEGDSVWILDDNLKASNRQISKVNLDNMLYPYCFDWGENKRVSLPKEMVFATKEELAESIFGSDFKYIAPVVDVEYKIGDDVWFMDGDMPQHGNITKIEISIYGRAFDSNVFQENPNENIFVKYFISSKTNILEKRLIANSKHELMGKVFEL